MLTKQKQYLAGADDKATANAITKAIQWIFKNQVLASFGLNFGAGLTVGRTNTAAASWAVVNGIPVKVAASSALPALTGLNLVSGQRAVVSYFVDTSGVITASQGNVATSNSSLIFPAPPNPDTVCIGYLIVEAAATFTGGTTALDAANITSTFISQIDGLPVIQDAVL